MFLSDKLTIKGYLINEKNLNHMIMDEYARLENSIIGYYSDAFGIGFLEVNKKIKDNATDNYLLIEIDNSDGRIFYKDTVSSVEISYKEYDEENNNTNYSLPVNKYIIESIYGKNSKTRNENKYCIYKTKNIKNPILLEISTESNETEIIFGDGLEHHIINGNENEKGFQKYMIYNDVSGEINFKVKNNGLKKSNYLIKYSYYDKDEKKTFIFDAINLNNDKNSDNVSFNYIQANT